MAEPNQTNNDAGKPQGDGDPALTVLNVGDGKTLSVTQDELVALATKSAGADRKFQEAAELRKQYEGLDAEKARKGMSVMSLAEKISSGTASEVEAAEFLKAINLDPAVLEGEPTGRKNQDRQPPKKVTVDDLDDRLKAILSENEEAAVKRTEEQIKENVRNFVDKDPHISKIRSVVPESKKQAFDNVIYDMAIEDTLGRVYGGQRMGPEMLTLVVQRLRNRVDNLGIPAEIKDLPLSQSIRGLEHMASVIGSHEPIKREAVGTDRYEENAIERFAQMLTRRQRAGA